jgi:outer membrane protein, heavy metal efflux system
MLPPPLMSLREWACVLGAVAGLSACRSRELPARFPDSSPASPEAAAARPATVTTALDEEPPLPGEPAARWPGLAASESAQPTPGTTQESAKPVTSLDVDAAVRLALQHNRALRAQLFELGIVQGQIDQAGLIPNPVAEAELLPELNSQIELRLEYNLTGAILAPLRARALEPNLEAARYRAALATLELGYQVRVACYRLQASEQRLALRQRVLDAQVAGRDAARALARAGNSSALEVATAETVFEQARLQVAAIELDVAADRERLQRLLGLHGNDTGWVLRGALAEVPPNAQPPDALERRALEANLELMEMRQRLEALARRTGLARTVGWLPDVTVDAHLLHGDPESHLGAPTDRRWRLGGGVSVQVPLFDRQQGNVRALESEFDANRERYLDLAIEVRSAAREVRNRLLSAHARARHTQSVIQPLQRGVTEQTLLQYNAMQMGVFQLLQAREQELTVELSLVEAQRDYWVAAAELEVLLLGRHALRDSGRSAGERSAGERGVTDPGATNTDGEH